MTVQQIAGWILILGCAPVFTVGLICLAREGRAWWRQVRPARRVRLEQPGPVDREQQWRRHAAGMRVER